jgi:cyclic beta-1,2-glucan synthetase
VSLSSRRFTSAHLAAPRTQLLSNGRYSVMLTTAGSGYSRWRDLAVTRWREDPTCDPWGSYVFLRDVRDGQVWSAGYQPIGREPESYEVDLYEERVEIVRKDGAILTRFECLLSAEDDIEVRRIALTNQARTAREIELTSYAELVLGNAGTDAAHPAFSKMFVQTEHSGEHDALLATRRPRDAGETPLWAAHFCTLEGLSVGGVQFETDRARFLGRGHEVRNATAVMDARPLSNTVGTVLDPVFSLRRRVRIEPRETVQVCFWTGVSASRLQALALVKKYAEPGAYERVKTQALKAAQDLLRELGVSAQEAQAFQEIAGRVLYADPSMRAPRELLTRNVRGPRELWSHGISGDLPIVLLRIAGDSGLSLLTQMLRAQEYWRAKGVAVDLVVLNEVPDSEGTPLRATLESTVAAHPARTLASGATGSVTLLHAPALTAQAQELLATAARAILVGNGAELHTQAVRPVELAPRRRRRRENLDAVLRTDAAHTAKALEFFNGLGGFSADGREYVITLSEAQWTPAPWVNVIANPQFGFMASTDGSGSTWSLNAQQNQVTPWSNDPVSNTPSEVVYIRDQKSGDLWSATALPVREPALTYVVRHGFGYTRSEHSSHGIALDLLQFVPLKDPVKISRLTLSNRSGEARRLSVTHYVDWVLGNQRSRGAPYMVTALEPSTGALLARNPWSLDYASQIAFMDAGCLPKTYTGDRAEFIGRHGSLAEPVALLGLDSLSNRLGGGFDPCGATQTQIDLKPGETAELRLLLGVEQSQSGVVSLIERYRTADLDAVFKEVTDFWERTLSAVQVKTPDRSMDILLNGWLLYQTLSCRVWGRTAFYQSSGAYGFRDQLQDVMALCVAAPAETRAHILRAAARQFAAGDVQHWWLPTTGQGIQTRVSDDRIWLPFVVARYLEVTEDFAVLDECVPFLAGGPLAAGQSELFAAPGTTEAAPLFEHCVRALNSALAIGTHGLPLFGTGDWNDGMNRVGVGGRGESVWLAWFLNVTLNRFAPLAERRNQTALAEEWRKHAFALLQAIEREAWDGDWYRRGYYDDGTPLGSVSSDECRIDSVAQSWAVISGGGEHGHAVRAMSAVNAQLVSRGDGLVKLFTPPFDHSAHDPGYIKAYPPGLRENGGQYTHAAIWTTLAWALLGQGERAVELFSLLNPINHASTRTGIHRYKVEPYVVCADVYSSPAHIGRGGWTWYTGSAAWMYRTGIEGILGINVQGTTLKITPAIPRTWGGFEFTLKFGSSRYRVEVENRRDAVKGVLQTTLDGQDLAAGVGDIKLKDDGRYHYAKVILGS